MLCYQPMFQLPIFAVTLHFFYLSNDQLLTIMNIKKSSHLENRILVLKVHMQTEMYYQSVQVYHKFIYLKIS